MMGVPGRTKSFTSQVREKREQEWGEEDWGSTILLEGTSPVT
jgi:hypothetical protein